MSAGLAPTLARMGAVAGLLWLMATVTAMVWPSVASASTTPTVAISPSASAYANGQTVSVSVGPNSLFTPASRVVILECSDPGGSVANLPTSFSSCDGNTVEADSVIVEANGSFSESAYTLYALPNAVLGEQANWQPVCSPTQPCVLYVGENQNDFTKPKVFSQPFTFTSTAPTIAGGGSAPSTSTSAPGSGASGSGASGSGASGTTGAGGPGTGTDSAPAVTGTGTLAFTGPPAYLAALAALGAALVGIGTLGRLAARRWER